MISHDVFDQMIQSAMKENPRWRYGQTVFNVAWDLWPGFIDQKIRGSELDPFYQDKKVDALLDRLYEEKILKKEEEEE